MTRLSMTTFGALLVLATAAYGAQHQAKELSCDKIIAFNARQVSMQTMMQLPCRCIPISERADKVYEPDHVPANMTCGNHLFYDKSCHLGLTCE